MPPRRVLMVAHHFPPAAGSGANRALAFVRYLPERGWVPTVLTPGAAWAVPRDDDLARQIPAGTRVVRTRSFERRPRPSNATATTTPSRRPNALRSHLGHLRRFPDAHIGWLPFAVAAGLRERHDVAYSSSGPFTSHLVGLLLKRLTHRPWVAELRDGWYRWNRAIFPDYPRWRGILEARLEAAAIRSADRVVLVTDRMADAFRCQYADLPEEHFRVVSNGFDPAQFDETLDPATNSGFEVVHTGALYYGRSLTTFLQGATDIARRRSDFALTLIGTLDAAARAEVEHSPIRANVRLLGQVSHAESLAAMRRASLLLLVANTTPGAEAAVPGKLFEYLAIGRPILAVAPAASATADVLSKTGGGYLAPADDPTAIACGLERGVAGAIPPPDQAKVARFSRRELAGDLAAVFDELV